MRLPPALAGFLAFCGICRTAPADAATPFQRPWTYISATSAVIYWQLDEIGKSATSCVEYGPTASLGIRTGATTEPRWSHFHRLTGLQAGRTYHYRMVILDPKRRTATKSDVLQFTTRAKTVALRVPEQVDGPPFDLDRRGATYVLTEDVTADGTAFVISADDVTLDLDGHTVVFGSNTADQVRGVWAKNKGTATICNGHIVQGARSKAYSAAVESRWRDEPTEIFGISTDVHRPCAYPIKFLGRARDAHIHHNLLSSRVTEIESRHYPGNDLLRLDISDGRIHVHDNILTEGCHVAMRLTGTGDDVDVHHNDIRHHQQYVNGYALAASCAGLHLHHNKVTSCGRGVHLTSERIRVHDNYLDIYGHQQLDDIPKGSRPFKHQRVELHGIKFEGKRVQRCVVRNNVVRIVQPLPRDSGGRGRPKDRITSGVYVRSRPSRITPDRLTDSTRRWERDRWKGCFVKYAPSLPPAQIKGNDATTLFADFGSTTPSPYTIYMKWDYAPATPLNIACDHPNAMNEVHHNTFIALTEYRKTRHGGYGRSGQWASAVYFVAMNKGPAERGQYAISIHDNRFISNDLFVSSARPVTVTVRMENNTFTLATQPPPTDTHRPFRGIRATLERIITSGHNTFHGMKP